MRDVEGQTYEAIARNLREFGYPDTTAGQIRETHEAMLRGDMEMPHGIISMFAESQLRNAQERGLIRS